VLLVARTTTYGVGIMVMSLLARLSSITMMMGKRETRVSFGCDPSCETLLEKKFKPKSVGEDGEDG
jgi:hypothetical protein